MHQRQNEEEPLENGVLRIGLVVVIKKLIAELENGGVVLEGLGFAAMDIAGKLVEENVCRKKAISVIFPQIVLASSKVLEVGAKIVRDLLVDIYGTAKPSKIMISWVHLSVPIFLEPVVQDRVNALTLILGDRRKISFNARFSATATAHFLYHLKIINI